MIRKIVFPQSLKFSSLQMAARRDRTTGLVDWYQVRGQRTTLISLFGWNNNAATRHIQFFDSVCPNGPTTGIADTDNTGMTLVLDIGVHNLKTGQAVQTAGITGLTAGQIYFVRVTTPQRFELYDTYAHATATTGAITGRAALTNNGESGTLTWVPDHSFAAAAANNYSLIIPATGIQFDTGVLVAVSTTPTLYTAGVKDVTMYGTVSDNLVY